MKSKAFAVAKGGLFGFLLFAAMGISEYLLYVNQNSAFAATIEALTVLTAALVWFLWARGREHLAYSYFALPMIVLAASGFFRLLIGWLGAPEGWNALEAAFFSQGGTALTMSLGLILCLGIGELLLFFKKKTDERKKWKKVFLIVLSVLFAVFLLLVLLDSPYRTNSNEPLDGMDMMIMRTTQGMALFWGAMLWGLMWRIFQNNSERKQKLILHIASFASLLMAAFLPYHERPQSAVFLLLITSILLVLYGVSRAFLRWGKKAATCTDGPAPEGAGETNLEDARTGAA